MKKTSLGFSLIELMVAAIVLGILASVSVPSFLEMRRANLKSAELSDLQIDFMLARSEAVKRKIQVGVCASNNTTAANPTCGAVTWHSGWLVFLDADSNGDPDTPGDVIRVHNQLTGNTIISDFGGRYTYGATGFGSGAGTLTFCDDQGDRVARAILISATGRTKVSETASDGTALTGC